MSGVLVLLQGTNPLPNYVAASFLLRHGPEHGLPRPQHLLVLSTPQVAEATEALLTLLRQAHTDLGISASEERLADPNDAELVVTRVRAALARLGATRPHLNYTGGTKVMAVHAARALGGDADFSYLDARRHRLFVEGRGLVPPLIAPDLREYVRLRLEQLAALHQAALEPLPPDDPRQRPLPAATSAAAQVLATIRPLEWTTWLGNLAPLLSRAVEGDGQWPRGWPTRLPWHLNLLPVAAGLATDLGLDPGARHAFMGAGEWAVLRPEQVRVAACFLRQGGWLEQVIEAWTRRALTERAGSEVEVLRSRRLRAGIYLWASPSPPGEEETGEDGEAAGRLPGESRPEVDVLAVVGYQLVAISCTASARYEDVVKRAYEVWYRARQLGGDEGRAVVVSLAEAGTVERARDNLRNAYGGAANVWILGVDDLAGVALFAARLERLLG